MEAKTEKELNLISSHEDEELDKMRGFGSGSFPIIDTLECDDDGVGEEGLH